jgi:hypothetical protein
VVTATGEFRASTGYELIAPSARSAMKASFRGRTRRPGHPDAAQIAELAAGGQVLRDSCADLLRAHRHRRARGRPISRYRKCRRAAHALLAAEHLIPDPHKATAGVHFARKRVS